MLKYLSRSCRCKAISPCCCNYCSQVLLLNRGEYPIFYTVPTMLSRCSSCKYALLAPAQFKLCCCLQALLDHTQAIMSRDSEALLREQCSSLATESTAGTPDLSSELWAWEAQFDLKDVLSGVMSEQTEFLSAVQSRLQKVQQLL